MNKLTNFQSDKKSMNWKSNYLQYGNSTTVVISFPVRSHKIDKSSTNWSILNLTKIVGQESHDLQHRRPSLTFSSLTVFSQNGSQFESDVF